MIKNKQPELILSFAGITGHARKVLSHNIQTNLFKFGYRWSPNGWDGRPDCLDKDALCINSHEWNARDITYSTLPVNPHGAPQMVFDAATQADLFIEAAKKACCIQEIIDGVKVTVTFDEVKLDATDLLTSVGAKAREIQSQTFGDSKL
jgi:hypothetical protein